MRRPAFLLTYALAWVPFWALYAIALTAGGRMAVDVACQAAAWSVAPAALLGLGAWWVAGRIARRRLSRPRLLGAHGALALLYAALWTAPVVAQIARYAPGAMAEYLRFGLAWQLVMGTMLYGVVVGARQLLEGARAARAREAAVARAEALRTRAELQALRARLDPHFLFNTLHSVTALVRTDAAAAERALERFAELLRYVLDAERRGRDDAPLSDELAFVRAYVELERIRFGDRLRYVEQVDPDALECAVPPLTLQPLVENAIRHGLAPLARGGTLRVAAAFDDDALVLEVGDDGAGAAAAERPGGIGLATVRQRLQARFPGEASAEVTTAPGEGFVVRLRLPAALPAPAGVLEAGVSGD
jgi:signal transduction histidine kinase